MGGGTSAWAETVGASDLSTGYLGANSTIQTIANGGAMHYVFNVTKATDEYWKNWILWVAPTGSSVTWENATAIVRGDNWEDKSASNTGCVSTFNWETFNDDMNGATVDMAISYNGGSFFMTSSISKGSKHYNYSYTKAIDGTPSTIDVCLSVNAAYLEITTSKYYAPVASTTVNATLDHTASTNKDQSTILYSLDGESEIYNSDHGSNGWSGFAFAQFSYTIPSEATVTAATLNWSINAINKTPGNMTLLYNLTPGTSIDYSTISGGTAGLLRYASNRSDALFNQQTSSSTRMDFNTDVLSAVKSTKSQGFVIFQWTGNNRRPSLCGKASENAPSLSITYTNTATASYTVNFLNAADGTVIKSAATHDGIPVGSIMEATSEEKATFTDADHKYVYASSTVGIVDGEGTNEINVYFTVINKESITVKAVDDKGNELTTLYSENAFLDGSTVKMWSKYIKVGEDWYVTEAPYGKVITEATNEVVYVKSDVAYFFEYEGLNNSRKYGEITGDYANYSNGGGYGLYNGANSYSVAISEAGYYDLTLAVVARNGGKTDKHIVKAKSGDTYEGSYEFAHSSNTGTYTVKGIYIPAGYSLYLEDGTPANSNAYYDYITLTPTKVSATLGANGYTTFASPYALDLTQSNLPAGVKAYKAAVNGTTVRFTELNQTVPANTGVLLEGTADAIISIPVVASGDDVSENAFEVNTAGTTFTAESGYTYYGLRKDSNPLSFWTFNPATVAIPANKAYLKVANVGGVHALNVLFDDTTDGIQSVDKAQHTDGNYYDLSGRRVMNPTKGIYVKAGKKVVVK